MSFGESPYFVGASEYMDSHPEFHETEPRIYVKCHLSGSVEPPILALLDTGAHYCIPDQGVVAAIREHLSVRLGETALQTARGQVRGDLYLHPITFIAEAGEPLDVDVVVFVSSDWRGPSFLGYTGALDRIQFAVQPHQNRFLFGPI